MNYLPALFLRNTLWIEIIQWVVAGLITSFLLYYFIEWFFRFTGIEKFIHKILRHAPMIGKDSLAKALGKYASIFIFILFLRKAVAISGYVEVEKFLDSVAHYVPYLFGAVFVFYIGLQTSKTFYDIIFNATVFDNPRTAKIIAHFTRVIFLFFVFTVVINLINAGSIEIIPDYLTKAILIGFVASTSLALGLSFGLGGKEAAEQFIHEYLEKKEHDEKNLKK